MGLIWKRAPRATAVHSDQPAAAEAQPPSPSSRIGRKQALLALAVVPLAAAAFFFSQPDESPAQRTLAAPAAATPQVIALPAPKGDLESALPVSASLLHLGSLGGVALEAETATAAHAVVIEVGPGDTLMGLLTRQGVASSDAHQAVEALTTVFSPKGLRAGQQITLTFLPGAGFGTEEGDASPALQLASLVLKPSVEQNVQVVLGEEGYEAAAVERPLQIDLRGERGVIQDSLFASASKAGVPTQTLIEMIRLFSYDVDFQREIQPGDDFELLYEAYYDENGELVKSGKILFANLTLSGKSHALYAYTPASGIEDYFDASGQSIRKALLKTPIDGARISSNFGMRKHPILGYSKMHKGTDFAAPSGTPIYAAGDGVVEMAGWNGGYGKYVRLKHNSTYKTAYAHMSKIAPGLGKGDRVKQGDVIGYVGTTGQSTGPHLHYEVHLEGKQVNPLDIKLPAGEKLAGKDLAAFKALVAEIDAQRATTVRGPQVAESPDAAGALN